MDKRNKKNNPEENNSSKGWEQIGDVNEKNSNSSNRSKGIIIALSASLALACIALIFLIVYGGELLGEKEQSSEDAVSNEQSAAENSLEAESSQIPSEEPSGNSSEEASVSDVDVSEESSEEASEESSAELEHGFVINNMGYTYLYYGNGYQQFNGTSSTANRYADAVKKLQDALSNVPAYAIMAPTSVEFASIPREIYSADNFFNQSQSKYNGFLQSSLGEEISFVDAYSEIAAHAAEEKLYLATDRNWSADAAYYAYSAFCAKSGNTPISRDSLESGEYAGYLGSFYNATGSSLMRENADTVKYYKIDSLYPCNVTMYSGGLAYKNRALIYANLTNPVTQGYYAFLGGYGSSYTISSQSSQTEKSLLVVGDSSGLAFTPYLAANYRNIYYLNVESYSGTLTEYLADKQIDECVFISYATSCADSSFAAKLNKLAN